MGKGSWFLAYSCTLSNQPRPIQNWVVELPLKAKNETEAIEEAKLEWKKELKIDRPQGRHSPRVIFKINLYQTSAEKSHGKEKEEK